MSTQTLTRPSTSDILKLNGIIYNAMTEFENNNSEYKDFFKTDKYNFMMDILSDYNNGLIDYNTALVRMMEVK